MVKVVFTNEAKEPAVRIVSRPGSWGINWRLGRRVGREDRTGKVIITNKPKKPTLLNSAIR